MANLPSVAVGSPFVLVGKKYIIFIYLFIYIYTYIYTHTYIYIYIYIYVYIYIYTYIYIYIYIYIHTYIYIYAYIYICTYIYTYLHTKIFRKTSFPASLFFFICCPQDFQMVIPLWKAMTMTKHMRKFTRATLEMQHRGAKQKPRRCFPMQLQPRHTKTQNRQILKQLLKCFFKMLSCT